MRDFADELPGYLHNRKLCAALDELTLRSGVAHLPDNLLQCYEKLVSLELIDRRELELIALWNEDLKVI